jgi:hypothetical protein
VLACGALLSLAACDGAGDPSSAQSSGQNTSSSTSPPADGAVTLSWVAPTSNTDGTALTNLVGYHIYYGNSPAKLTQSIAISKATVLSYEISGLASGTWYFAVAADAANGSQSEMSDVGSETI